MADLAGWLLFQTPTIKGDDGAFLMALLFLLTVAVAAGLLGLAYVLTGGLDIEDRSGRGLPK
jgi:hypothetical protein